MIRLRWIIHLQQIFMLTFGCSRTCLSASDLIIFWLRSSMMFLLMPILTWYILLNVLIVFHYHTLIILALSSSQAQLVATTGHIMAWPYFLLSVHQSAELMKWNWTGHKMLLSFYYPSCLPIVYFPLTKIYFEVPSQTRADLTLEPTILKQCLIN